MKQTKMTINELVKRLTDEMQRIGYSPYTIYREFIPRMTHVVHYYEAKGEIYYSPTISAEYISYNVERCGRNEITDYYVRQIRSIIAKMDEFYTTGTLHIRANKHGTIYVISAENENLIDRFIGWKNYGPNTRDDVRWAVRKYLFYLENLGFSSMEDVPIDTVREFILKTAADVKAASLHNLLLYLKYFHIFLKENNVPAPDCVELFSYKVYREMPIQSYVTDEELNSIFSVIDMETPTGKRDYAIIQLAATTGLRASDIIRIKLSDIDWRKGEIRIKQKKTGYEVIVPLVSKTAEALQDYILDARPASEYPELFLRVNPPCYAIMDAAAIGDMFKRYEKRAGIDRQALDGKGFHGLRRRLAKKLLVSGSPTTEIAQILGHNDVDSVRQYLSLDTSNLKECALDFHEIPLSRKEFC